ncbi:HET-domain-containing protein [Hypoxylon rubiginosum]|uniref:HET-domain-containing protein n=1 Tax=Hypoxylon rubiginosum TaxID=110542 RepID=A0ACB9Z209_9PEZI|nr:HET-domain-containing protein [Hypoxylon rubiginosum]
MDSCTACRNLEPLPGLSGGFITGGVGQDLQYSAPACQFCSILWEGLEAFCLENPGTVQWIALRQDEDSFRLQYKQSPNDKRWMGLHFYTKDTHDPLSEVFRPSVDLEPDTGCSKYLSQMKGWIDSCNEKHALCQSRLSEWLPTRVLDVSREPGRVFLYEPDEADKGPYVALSHCWGGAVPIMTTAKTIDSFKAGIPLDAFPRTFQDAIFVTQQIQCRFLWIDSLCIIQDDTEDWKNEASRMADVYGNSYVTVAAAASINSRGGLFRKHNVLDVKHTVERHAQGGQPTSVTVRPSLEHTPYYASSPYGLEPSTTAPLLERSWCFQEYLLSPRVLSFTQWETLWVCASQRLCNCGEFREDTRALVSESDLKVRFDTQLHEASPKNLRRLWRDVVEAYLLKRLTYDSDRLPALAGIAELFFKKGLGRYVNGLWEPTILSDLFWELDWAFVGNYGIIAERSTDQAMPSWSWASLSGSFRYIPSTYALEGIEVLDICYDPIASRPFAEICAKAITIRGILTRASAWGGTDLEKSPSNHRRWIQVPGAQEHSWLVDVASELSCDVNSPADVSIICGTKGPGLVLHRIEGTLTTYRRLGFIEKYPPKTDQVESTTIQLI